MAYSYASVCRPDHDCQLAWTVVCAVEGTIRFCQISKLSILKSFVLPIFTVKLSMSEYLFRRSGPQTITTVAATSAVAFAAFVGVPVAVQVAAGRLPGTCERWPLYARLWEAARFSRCL